MTFNMNFIFRKKDELPLLLKLLKQAIDDETLSKEETLIAHELYEDLKND